jgi:hypothetical protein
VNFSAFSPNGETSANLVALKVTETSQVVVTIFPEMEHLAFFRSLEQGDQMSW